MNWGWWVPARSETYLNHWPVLELRDWVSETCIASGRGLTQTPSAGGPASLAELITGNDYDSARPGGQEFDYESLGGQHPNDIGKRDFRSLLCTFTVSPSLSPLESDVNPCVGCPCCGRKPDWTTEIPLRLELIAAAGGEKAYLASTDSPEVESTSSASAFGGIQQAYYTNDEILASLGVRRQN